MKKYKLINVTTKQETICDKVTIDGFDYYVSDENRIVGNFYIGKGLSGDNIFKWDSSQEEKYPNQNGKVIATNNPNIDIPKVMDYVHKLACDTSESSIFDTDRQIAVGIAGFYEGYNKSQETHRYSASDMIEFSEWCDNSEEAARFWRMNRVIPNMDNSHLAKVKQKRKELFQIWEEQRPKIVYYE